MPTTSQIEVSKLKLDLKNFRTVPQKNEEDAIRAMISIKPERFYAIIESIIEDGYLLTENIIVLNDGQDNIVKEGNRRIAAMKLIHGLYKFDEFGLPISIVESIKKIDSKWKSDNLEVPCTVFSIAEADKVDRVVTLAHGKGEKASRDPWNSVARARHNRDVKNATENGLDLLEKYLKDGKNINNQQKDRWGGEYPLTVLDEALRKSFLRIGYASAVELVQKYPKINYLTELENILLEIGLEQIKFETMRNPQLDFPSNYGIPQPNPQSVNASNQNQNVTNPNTTNPNTANPNTTQNSNSNQNPTTASSPQTNQQITSHNSNTTSNTNPVTPSAPKAVSVNDPKNVANLLKKFSPRGAKREKVVTIRDEIKKLKIQEHPIAFCFLLRSMFEISAKAYCTDHNISFTKSNAREKTLAELLRDITSHLTNNNSNIALVRVLHGSMTEIGKPEGILSVTSMNQLVHNPTFSISPPDICIMFSNIYPLLEAMN